MHPERFEGKIESSPEISVTRPALESFSTPARAADFWPAEVATNESFIGQIEDREELNDTLDTILESLGRPDTHLKTAIAEGNITEDQVTTLYASYSKLLENDAEYARAILYFPFEFLPDTTWHPATPELQKVKEKFADTYMKTWRKLLSVHDVRANFVDGDVLEEQHRTGDLPRAVKAAHLIPKLVEHGLLDVRDVLTLMEKSEDQTLRDSVADTIPVLADLGFLPNIDTQNEKIQTTPEEPADITEKRSVWLKQEKKQRAIESAGKDMSLLIIEHALTNETVTNLLTPDADVTNQQVLIEGARQAIESVAGRDLPEARNLYAQYKEALVTIWEKNVPENRHALTKAFCRLHGLGIVETKQLADLGISMPKLAGPFSENLPAMKKELREVRDILASIESNPELSHLIYPVAMIFGSRLKGYGSPDADIDVGVFIKPGTPYAERERLQALLKEAFHHDKIQGEVVEFWLEEKDGKLSIHDFAQPDPLLGESITTHVLFGAAWEGDTSAIRELREKLLVPYMYDTKKITHGREARGLYLEEIERDALQYRLMHKGYERFFPPYGGISTAHANRIDAKSMFYDSGYRQLATKLFARRVFIPKIPAPQK